VAGAALSLTAQAFLLTIALDPEMTALGRGLSSLLACLAALMSMQLLARHRANEVTDAMWLRKHELDDPAAGVPTVHGRRELATLDDPVMNWFSRCPSVRLWFYALDVFAVAGGAIVITNVLDPGALRAG
jgi:hypothetical protein